MAREVPEELGRAVRITGRIGGAVQFFYAEQRWYEMSVVFFRGHLEAEPIGVGSDERQPFFHACHAWAVSQA